MAFENCPRIIHAGSLDKVEDLGSPLRYRLNRITATYPPSPQRAAGLIAGLVPRATGITDPAMRRALDERELLMTQRLDALTAKLLAQPAPWMHTLDELPPEARAAVVRAVAAYRDRWGITAASPIAAIPIDDAQDRLRTRPSSTLCDDLTGDERAATMRPANQTSQRQL